MDLLIFLYLISITYCEVTWLPSVTGYNEFDFEDGYSGIIGRSIVGIKIEGELNIESIMLENQIGKLKHQVWQEI